MAIKIVCSNNKAFHEFEIEDKIEAGMVLVGTEVKAIRAGKINIRDGWVRFTDEGAFLQQVHISPYEFGNINNHQEERPRKLLLKKSEINRLQEKAEVKGYSVVPLKVYIKGSWIKVELGLGRGKKFYDKRMTVKKREADIEMARAMRHPRK